jgi:hypothetical protein
VEYDIFEPLDDMIARTEPTRSAASHPETQDEFVCVAPAVLRRMMTLRERLKRANKQKGVDPILYAVNVFHQAELNARIGRLTLECAAKHRPDLLEGVDVTWFKVTRNKEVVYREK